MSTQPTRKVTRRRYTRRQFLAGAGAAVALPQLHTVKAAESPADSTPPAALPPTSPDGYVLNVQTVATVPNRADIVNPATLADYCAQMEVRLDEYAQRVQAWAADGDIPLREFLENEFYALLDSLAVLTVVAEAAGLSSLAVEILTIDDPINYVQCVHTQNNPEFRQHMIDQELWGQEPPAISKALRRFTVLKTVIGDSAARELSPEGAL